MSGQSYHPIVIDVSGGFHRLGETEQSQSGGFVALKRD